MSKLEELRDYLLKHVRWNITTEIDYRYERLIIYNNHRVVCYIKEAYGGFNIQYVRPYIFDNWSKFSYLISNSSVSQSINNRLGKYNRDINNTTGINYRGGLHMENKHFIVEKMEVEQRCCEPDVINMTVRQEPDGIPFQTGRELKTLIESLDPDKLSSDYRINVNVNVNSDTVQKPIYMMSARGSGKTKWVSEMLKNKTVVYNGNIHTNIENVIFNDPATIVFWTDGSKTVVKCQKGETFDPEKGLAMAISKKVLGNDYSYYETFAKYIGRYHKKHGIITPNEVFYNGRTYVLSDKYTVKSKEE